MATIIRSGGSTEPTAPLDPVKGFELDQLQGIVGGLIEIIYLPNNFIMVINEEGKLDGLPVNIRASFLANLPNDYIVGDVLLCKSSEVQ